MRGLYRLLTRWWTAFALAASLALLGAAHAFELPYLFGMASAAQNAEQNALKATMSTYWTNFARRGNPNGSGTPVWAGFRGGAVQALDVASGGGVTGMTADAFRDQHLCKTAWAKQTF